MPLYEYQARDPDRSCDRCREAFTVRQAMSDPALQTCPDCGAAVRRLISACSMSTTPSARAMLSDRNLKAKGFTKLVNEGGGRFRRTV